MAWVAIAGPTANLIMAFLWALVLKAGYMLLASAPEIGQFMIYSGIAGVSINIILLVLNLLPIPPLDGSRILSDRLFCRENWLGNTINLNLMACLFCLGCCSLGF